MLKMIMDAINYKKLYKIKIEKEKERVDIFNAIANKIGFLNKIPYNIIYKMKEKNNILLYKTLIQWNLSIRLSERIAENFKYQYEKDLEEKKLKNIQRNFFNMISKLDNIVNNETLNFYILKLYTSEINKNNLEEFSSVIYDFLKNDKNLHEDFPAFKKLKNLFYKSIEVRNTELYYDKKNNLYFLNDNENEFNYKVPVSDDIIFDIIMQTVKNENVSLFYKNKNVFLNLLNSKNFEEDIADINDGIKLMNTISSNNKLIKEINFDEYNHNNIDITYNEINTIKKDLSLSAGIKKELLENEFQKLFYFIQINVLKNINTLVNYNKEGILLEEKAKEIKEKNTILLNKFRKEASTVFDMENLAFSKDFNSFIMNVKNFANVNITNKVKNIDGKEKNEIKI